MSTFSEEAPRVEFERVRTVTAQKDHCCDLCHRPIPAGTRYDYGIGKVEGKFTVQRGHRPCCINWATGEPFETLPGEQAF
jgi:hypothetical protein